MHGPLPAARRRSEGVRGFYHGLGPSILRVLPATCITFVAYENITYALRMAAIRREESRSSQ
jgi:solute carrier family 25 folate transporter 32